MAPISSGGPVGSNRGAVTFLAQSILGRAEVATGGVSRYLRLLGSVPHSIEGVIHFTVVETSPLHSGLPAPNLLYYCSGLRWCLLADPGMLPG